MITIFFTFVTFFLIFYIMFLTVNVNRTNIDRIPLISYDSLIVTRFTILSLMMFSLSFSTKFNLFIDLFVNWVGYFILLITTDYKRNIINDIKIFSKKDRNILYNILLISILFVMWNNLF